MQRGQVPEVAISVNRTPLGSLTSTYNLGSVCFWCVRAAHVCQVYAYPVEER